MDTVEIVLSAICAALFLALVVPFLWNKFTSKGTTPTPTTSKVPWKKVWGVTKTIVAFPFKLTWGTATLLPKLATWVIWIGLGYATILLVVAFFGNVVADRQRSPNAGTPWEHSPLGSRTPSLVVPIEKGTEVPIRPTIGDGSTFFRVYGGEVIIRPVFTDGSTAKGFLMGNDTPHNLGFVCPKNKVVDKLVVDEIISRLPGHAPQLVLWYLQRSYMPQGSETYVY